MSLDIGSRRINGLLTVDSPGSSFYKNFSVVNSTNSIQFSAGSSSLVVTPTISGSIGTTLNYDGSWKIGSSLIYTSSNLSASTLNAVSISGSVMTGALTTPNLVLSGSSNLLTFNSTKNIVSTSGTVLSYGDTAYAFAVQSNGTFTHNGGAVYTTLNKPLYSDVGAAPSSHVGSGGTAHAAATETVAGFMSAADKVKIDNMLLATTTVNGVCTNF